MEILLLFAVLLAVVLLLVLDRRRGPHRDAPPPADRLSLWDGSHFAPGVADAEPPTGFRGPSALEDHRWARQTNKR